MSSPLDSNFTTSLTAAPRNSSCALSVSPKFFMKKEAGPSQNRNSNSNQLNHKARGEEKCQKSRKSRKFKVQ